jgi:hypothetical protein
MSPNRKDRISGHLSLARSLGAPRLGTPAGILYELNNIYN